MIGLHARARSAVETLVFTQIKRGALCYVPVVHRHTRVSRSGDGGAF